MAHRPFDEGSTTTPPLGPERPEQRLGRIVKRSREALGMSQEQLAQAMGQQGFPMHQTTLAKLEQAARPIRVDELFALERALRVTIPTLLGLSPTVEQIANNYERSLDVHMAIERTFHQMSEYTRANMAQNRKLLDEIVVEMNDFLNSASPDSADDSASAS